MVESEACLKEEMEPKLKGFEIIVHDCPAVFKQLEDEKHRMMCFVNKYEGGRWRYDVFLDRVWKGIVKTSLRKNELDALVADEDYRGILRKSADNLRLLIEKRKQSKDPKKYDGVELGNELAEGLLYYVLNEYYGSVVAIPKIYYKQNVDMHAFGADSVHVVKSSDGDISFWLGEAKIYDAVSKCKFGDIVKSVLNMLEKRKVRHENRIIRDDLFLYSDLSEETKTTISYFIDEDNSIDEYFERLNVPILVIVSCEIVKKSTKISREFKMMIRKECESAIALYYERQKKKGKEVVFYDMVTFHVIICPIPDKKEILDKFVLQAESYRSE